VAQGDRVRKRPTPPWELSGEGWKRTDADEPYRQFTIIATTTSFIFIASNSVPLIPYRTRLDNCTSLL
jgi:hypothetical protein